MNSPRRPGAGQRAPRGEEGLARRALGLLARREHSRAELVGKLVRAGHGRAEAERVVEDLSARGLVCDARFAEALYRSRVAGGSGPFRIRRDLETRGVEAAVIDRFVDPEDPEWESRARRAREKRFGVAPPGSREEALRQSRFLQGRGFTRRQIHRALEESGQE